MTDLNKRILNMINESEGHLTAEQAFLLAKEKKIDVSMASVYRILARLADEGKIRRISIPNKADFFDKTVEAHEHLICSHCGKITDIYIEDLYGTLREKLGFDVESFDLCLHGVCEDCKRKEKK